MFFLPVIAALLLQNWEAAAGPLRPQGESHLALGQILEIDDFECLDERAGYRQADAVGAFVEAIARLEIAVGTVHRKHLPKPIGSQSALFARFLNLIAWPSHGAGTLGADSTWGDDARHVPKVTCTRRLPIP